MDRPTRCRSIQFFTWWSCESWKNTVYYSGRPADVFEKLKRGGWQNVRRMSPGTQAAHPEEIDHRSQATFYCVIP